MAMKRRGERWLPVVVCLWVAVATAQTAPGPVVLTLLGTNYTARELEISPEALAARSGPVGAAIIQKAVWAAQLENGEFEITEEELKEFCRRSLPSAEEAGTTSVPSNLFETTWAQWQRDDPAGREAREFARWMLQDWKIQNALFGRHGGRVLLNGFNMPQAFDAVRAFFREREAAGDFVFHDETVRDLFWNTLRTLPAEPLLSEEEGRAALAVHPGERWKRHLLEFARQREMAAPAP